MPTIPPEESKTTSSPNLSFNMKDPLRGRTISTNTLLADGFIHYGKNSYEKDKKIIVFNGVYWELDLHRFQFMNELQEYLTNGKLPEE